jgi:HEAT repeat protein
VNWARLFGLNKPNVKSLARDGDIEGLIEAARYREVVRRVDGRVSDAGASIREAAILALRDTAGDRAGEALMRALVDPADRVRCAAILALYERGDDDSLALAAAHLRDEDGQALSTAFRALLELQKTGSTHKLVSAIVHREDERPVSEVDASILRELLDAEGADADGDVIDLLICALADPREDVAERAEDLLELLAPESVDSLVMELSRGMAPERAASVLGRIKDARALKALVTALRHPDPQVRMESCVALGELRDPAASEPLLVATRDPEHLVRAGAGAALDRIGTAAIAVSVASLLRPLLEKAPAELVRALEVNDPPLLEASANGDSGFHSTLLRRFARFIDRIEDARSGMPPHAGRPHHVTERAISTHPTGGRAISFPRQLGNGHATPTRGGKAAIAWPASNGKSSASLRDDEEPRS